MTSTAETLTEVTGLPEPLSEDELVRLDEESFTDYVHDCLTSTEHFLTLHRSRIVGRTVSALGALLRDLQETAQENRQDMSPAEFYRWWSEVGAPLRALIGRRIARAKGASRAAREKRLREEAGEEVIRYKVANRRLLDVVGRLAEEIHHHRLAVLAGGFEPEPHERAMWAALSSLTVPVVGEDVPLDEAIGRGLIGGAR